VPPTFVWLTRRALEVRTAEHSNGSQRFFYDYTRQHHDVRPAGMVFSVAVSPVRPSPPLQHHAGHCDDISDTVGACEDGTPAAVPRTPPCNGTLEPAHGRRHCAQDSPRRPNRSEIRQDGRQLRGTARHPFTCRRTVRHACKLLSPWPIKGGVAPQPQRTTDSNHMHAFLPHRDIGTFLNQYLSDLEARPPLPPRL
jgi:hypothetical protein